MNDELVVSNAIDAEPVGEPEPTLTKHEMFVRDLRAIASWVEKHPELGAPYLQRIDYWPDKGDMRKFVSAFGKSEKVVLADAYFILRKHFGDIRLEATWAREQVCERVVVGQEQVEEEVVVSQTKELRKVTKEKIEWRCHPVLEPKEINDGA
jgi:hypothetical protein